MGKILVTGGTGYLGTHMLVELVKQGYEPLCVDNLHNSNPSVLLAVKEICGKEIPFIKADAGDVAAMRALFAEYQIDAVIHFAGHKAVGESVAHPLMYYRNNYDSALTILEMCLKHGSALVFSSSATVYGVPHFLPLTEDHPLSAVNPYGRTKLYIEETIRDVALAHPEFNVSILRYFNSSAKTPTASPTTSCRSSARRRRASARNCRCSATTTTRRTARACATTSM